MAYKIEPHSEVNVDTPLSNFPVSKDSWDRMSDINSITYQLVRQYEALVTAGNLSAANAFLAANPELENCRFSAARENSKTDAITAIEDYLLNDVSDLYNEIAKNALGINDSPTPEQSDLVAHSAKYVNEIIQEQSDKIQEQSNTIQEHSNKIQEHSNKIQEHSDKYHTIRNVTLLATKWSDTYPHTQVVNVPDVTSTMDIKVVGLVRSSSNTQVQDKALKKASGFLIDNDNGVGNGTITFFALKKPEIDFTIITEGG